MNDLTDWDRPPESTRINNGMPRAIGDAEWIDVSEAGSNFEVQINVMCFLDTHRHRRKRYDGGVYPWEPGKPDLGSFIRKYPPPLSERYVPMEFEVIE